LKTSTKYFGLAVGPVHNLLVLKTYTPLVLVFSTCHTCYNALSMIQNGDI